MEREPRSDPRSHVFLMAVLCVGPTNYPVRVRNLSARGALLEGDSLPKNKSIFCLKRGSLAAAGEIAWLKSNQCGVRFSESITVADWVDRVGPVEQQRIDATVAAYRSGLTSRSAPISKSGPDRQTLLELSEILHGVSERLAALPEMSIAIAEELIRLDAAAQRLAGMGRRPL